jgi:hypothetical protein
VDPQLGESVRPGTSEQRCYLSAEQLLARQHFDGGGAGLGLAELRIELVQHPAEQRGVLGCADPDPGFWIAHPFSVPIVICPGDVLSAPPPPRRRNSRPDVLP